MKLSKSNKSIGVGGSLVIVIFIVICLTVFSVLSFETAYSDLKLSVKTEEMAVDYYLINGRGEEKLAEISDKLADINDIGLLENNFNDAVTNSLKDIKDIDIFEELEYIVVSYEVLGEKNQKICINLNILSDDNTYEPYYKIVSWNLTNIDTPIYDEEIYELWEGVDEDI